MPPEMASQTSIQLTAFVPLHARWQLVVKGHARLSPVHLGPGHLAERFLTHSWEPSRATFVPERQEIPGHQRSLAGNPLALLSAQAQLAVLPETTF